MKFGVCQYGRAWGPKICDHWTSLLWSGR